MLLLTLLAVLILCLSSLSSHSACRVRLNLKWQPFKSATTVKECIFSSIHPFTPQTESWRIDNPKTITTVSRTHRICFLIISKQSVAQDHVFSCWYLSSLQLSFAHPKFAVLFVVGEHVVFWVSFAKPSVALERARFAVEALIPARRRSDGVAVNSTCMRYLFSKTAKFTFVNWIIQLILSFFISSWSYIRFRIGLHARPWHIGHCKAGKVCTACADQKKFIQGSSVT